MEIVEGLKGFVKEFKFISNIVNCGKDTRKSVSVCFTGLIMDPVKTVDWKELRAKQGERY